jgi:hypothetical protein
MLWSFAGYCTRSVPDYGCQEIEWKYLLEHNISNHVEDRVLSFGASNR